MSAMRTASRSHHHRTQSPLPKDYNNSNFPPSPSSLSSNRNYYYNSNNSNSNNPISPRIDYRSPSDSQQQQSNGKLLNQTDGRHSAVVIDTSSLPESSLDHFMLNLSQDVNDQASALQFDLPLVPGDNISTGAMWNDYTAGNGPRVANSLTSIPIGGTKSRQLHQRGASSSSSIDSNDSATPLPHLYRQQQQQQQQQQRQHGQQGQRVMLSASRTPQKLSRLSNQLEPTSSATAALNEQEHLPTPIQTPVQEGFLRSSNPSASKIQQQQQQPQPLESTVAASLAMNQALLDPGHLQDDDLPGMSTGRHSFSSIGREPATPMTASGDHHIEEAMRSGNNGEKTLGIDAWLGDYLLFADESDVVATSRTMVPKFERTISDIYRDEGFIPHPNSEPVKQTSSPSMFLSPYNNSVTERLQAAQMARTSSSTSSQQSRGLSPFRADSPWVQGSRFSTAAQAREHQKAKADADELAYQISPHESSEAQTISPKDALLEYNPSVDEQPLFPQSSAAYGPTYGTVSADPESQSQYIGSSSMDFGNIISTSSAEQWQALAPFGQASVPPFTTASSQSYSFAPAMQVGNEVHVYPQLSTSSGLSTAPKVLNDNLKVGAATPEFPAHLTSMDSSASEAADPSSAASNLAMDSPKPITSSADSGTYSCTYHGCSQRFSTPQKLQKHKRDAHRSSSNITPGIGSGMSTAALMARNSQSGPHRCDRVNPKTGQPCNTVFSRPYDLTRHEDTTHNIRKQKIRCALCTEEKTFSRSDALTRHMRIVHPEVDFPGKHRRRGGASD